MRPLTIRERRAIDRRYPRPHGRGEFDGMLVGLGVLVVVLAGGILMWGGAK